MAGVSTKDIKNRIRSMESTKQITRAMEMVASSKLRRAQERIAACQPYFETLTSALSSIARSNRDFSSPYTKPSPAGKPCFVVVAGDRGLAGGYNHNLFALAQSHMPAECVVIPIGKKALEHFKSHGFPILTDAYSDAASLTSHHCFALAKTICEAYREGRFSSVELVYTRYDSILTQTPCVRRALPVALESGAGSAPVTSLTQYDPSAEEVFDAIVPECLSGLLYGALANAVASELSARRTAMDVATQNAQEMIDRLSLDYNRARQATITQELTEIVAGADA